MVQSIDLLKPSEYAAMHGVSRQYIDKCIKHGRIPTTDIKIERMERRIAADIPCPEPKKAGCPRGKTWKWSKNHKINAI